MTTAVAACGLVMLAGGVASAHAVNSPPASPTAPTPRGGVLDGLGDHDTVVGEETPAGSGGLLDALDPDKLLGGL